jgi:hypothetical protein
VRECARGLMTRGQDTGAKFDSGGMGEFFGFMPEPPRAGRGSVIFEYDGCVSRGWLGFQFGLVLGLLSGSEFAAKSIGARLRA